MTLDVVIGKYEQFQEGIIVVQCKPATCDICDIKHTLWPRAAYRSGSSDFYDFFKYYASVLYYSDSSFPEVKRSTIIKLWPLIYEIQQLGTPTDSLDLDRMFWLKYWTQQAVDQYGKDAVIKFN
jgi:hypothetical protein